MLFSSIKPKNSGGRVQSPDMLPYYSKPLSGYPLVKTRFFLVLKYRFNFFKTTWYHFATSCLWSIGLREDVPSDSINVDFDFRSAWAVRTFQKTYTKNCFTPKKKP